LKSNSRDMPGEGCWSFKLIDTLLNTIRFYILHIVFWVVNCPNFRLVVLNLLVFYAELYYMSIDLMNNDVLRLDACEECWS
jgi:hypothetical protein